jgi:uncharacterized tellurite resistance protein B-like protein
MTARLRSRYRDTHAAASLRAVEVHDQASPAATSGFAGGSTSPISRTEYSSPLSASVGTTNSASEDYAQALLRELPSTFRGLLYTRAGAIQLCYALLICERSPQAQQQHLGQIPEESVFTPNPGLLEKLLSPLSVLGSGVRLPALELAMPALRKLDPDEREKLLTACESLITADQRLSLFELTMISFLRKHLAGDAGRVVPVRYRNYRAVQAQLRVLFSLLARLGAESPRQQQALLEQTMAGFDNGKQATQLMPQVSLNQLREALWRLNQLAPLLKPGIIDACCHCVLADGEIRPREYQLIRLIADQLDCPMPPLPVTAAS